MNDVAAKESEYRNYIYEHQLNVKAAWSIMLSKCSEFFIEYPELVAEVSELVEKHDNSKFSELEFDGYRKYFYPTQYENKEDAKDEFDKAWIHHYTVNKHHWDHWKNEPKKMPDKYIIEMILDWIAMGMKFNNSAIDYYEKNKDNIIISSRAEVLLYKLCKMYY